MISQTEILKELFFEKTRIVLTILAISWGTFAVATMLAVGEGFKVTFAKRIAASGINLLTINGGSSSKPYHGRQQNIVIRLTHEDLQSIKNLPNISDISYLYSFSSNLYWKNNNTAITLNAVMPNYSKIHNIQVQPPGRFISQSDQDKHELSLVIGTNSFKTIFKNNPNVLNKVILLGRWPFKIIGVMREKTELMNGADSDGNLNWIPASTFEILTNPKNIDSITLSYVNPKMIAQTKAAIRSVVAQNHAVDPKDIGILNFTDLAKSQEQITSFLFGLQIFLGIIGGLTLFIAGVGIANVMYASVNRATSEIGLRKSLGATTTVIIMHYIAQSLVATFIGGIIGILATLTFSSIMKMVPMSGEFVKAMGRIEPVVSWFVIMVVICVLGIFGFLAGVFPALKAAKIDPAEALNYE